MTMKQNASNQGHKIVSKISTAMALGVVVALTGCANIDHHKTGYVPDDYRTRHPIVISEQDKILDLPVGLYSSKMTLQTSEVIQGFAQNYASSSADQILVVVPVGSANQGAASGYADKVTTELVKHGVSRSRIGRTTYDANEHGDEAPIRLVYTSISASTETCGQWPEDLLLNSNENNNYHNFGCATQSNLAAQIANPADLIAPRGMSPIDATRRATAIQTYQSDGAGLGVSSSAE